MMWGMVGSLLLLLAAGAGFWIGKIYAERKQLLSSAQESTQMDQIIRRHAGISRDECLKRLRDKAP